LIDAPADIILDADGGDVHFQDSGSSNRFISIKNSSGSCVISNPTADGDITFQGNDDGVGAVNALVLDMSDAGHATFNNGITLSDGNLKVADTHGIDFSSTSDASGMASELFDNYEEGTFTSSFGGSGGNQTLSYSFQFGTYVLIGKVVQLTISVGASNTPSGGSGDLIITGLPFTSKSGIQQAGSVAFTNTITTTSGTTQMGCNIEGGVAYLNVNEHEYSGASGMNRVAASGIHAANPRIVCSICYEVA
jgi:hypothetical protein